MVEKAIYYIDEVGCIDETLELIRFVRKLVDKFVETINCPSNWRSIGEELANKYYPGTWEYENLELWNYTED